MKSIMWKYMSEETEVLTNLLNNKDNLKDIDKLKNVEAIYFVAHGSSYNAAMSISSLLSKLCHIRVYVYNPSSFIYECHSIRFEDIKTTLVCVISQTGTSSGVIEAGEKAIDLGFKLLSITNVVDSPIDKMSNYHLYLECGEEDSNAKTKGYSSTLLLIMLLAIDLAYSKELISNSQRYEYLDSLKDEINTIKDVQTKVFNYCESNSYGINMNHLYVIGNGINHGSSMEGMLKLMETMCIPTMYSDIDEFSHGMHRSVNDKSSIVMLVDDECRDKMINSYKYFKDKNYNVLVLNTGKELGYSDEIYLGKDSFDSSVLLVISAIQVISAFVPEKNGLDPNRNANDDYTSCMHTRVS